MTENKNPCSDPSAEFERQRKRKVLLFTAIPDASSSSCCGSYSARQAPRVAGITSVLDGKAQATVGDKRKAANSSSARNSSRTHDDTRRQFVFAGRRAQKPRRACSRTTLAQRAAEANRDMQRQVQGFYAAPQRNAEAWKEQVAALQSQPMPERQQPDPLELAEEQYKLARKYLGGGTTPRRRGRADEAAKGFAPVRNAARSKVRSKPRRSTRGRISPSSATSVF